MPKEAYIDIEIGPDGIVEMEGKNFEGAACHEAMEHYEKAIGRTVKSRKTPAYYQKVKEKTKVKERA